MPGSDEGAPPTGQETRENTASHDRGPTSAETRELIAVTRQLRTVFITRRMATIWLVVIGLLVALCLAGVAVTALDVRANDRRLNAEERQTDILIECTTQDPNPSDRDPHECFEESQARQATVVEGLLDGFSIEITSQIDRVLRSVGVTPAPA